MFMYGADLPVPKPVKKITKASKISINVTSSHKTGTFRDGLDTMLAIADAHVKKYPNSILVCQEGRSLTTMLWGDGAGRGTEYDGISPEAIRALSAGGRARFYVDPNSWFEELGGCDFSFGTRLHGNISAILGGTPCLMVATDSRTRELGELFDIPWRRVDELNATTDVADLAREADFSKMISGHGERFAAYRSFMKRNDLPFSYDDPARGPAFESRLAATSLAPPAKGVNQDPTMGQLVRFRAETNVALKKLSRRVNKLQAQVAKSH